MVKKCLLVAAILAFAACLTASASATTQTIWDQTLIKAYNPVKKTWAGWKDVEGKSQEFQTTHIDVTLSGKDVTFELFTNIMQTGVSVDLRNIYRPADLAIDLNQDGKFETAISLFKGSLLGIDHNYKLGELYTNTTWHAPYEFYDKTSKHVPLSSYGVDATPSGFTPGQIKAFVWIKSGTDTGHNAEVYWDPYTEGSGDQTTHYKIVIKLLDINTDGDWNDFNLFWGTATCANDSIAGTVNIPPVPIPSTVWLLSSGLVGLAGLRRRSKR